MPVLGRNVSDKTTTRTEGVPDGQRFDNPRGRRSVTSRGLHEKESRHKYARPVTGLRAGAAHPPRQPADGACGAHGASRRRSVLRRHPGGALLPRPAGRRRGPARIPDRDRFVLSKGHASAALYATLAERGFFPARAARDLHAAAVAAERPPRSQQGARASRPTPARSATACRSPSAWRSRPRSTAPPGAPSS